MGVPFRGIWVAPIGLAMVEQRKLRALPLMSPHARQVEARWQAHSALHFLHLLLRNPVSFVAAPEAPGLGIDVNEELARAHPYTETGLHLQMQEDPCDWQNGNSFEGGAPAKSQ